MDKELEEELSLLPKSNKNVDNLEDYMLVANCLSVGITLQDLKGITYVGALKILLCFNEDRRKRKDEEATQQDIDKFLGG